MVERYNRTLESQLASFVKDHQLMSHWTAAHETTKFTPVMLMFGRELRIPLDLLMGRQREEFENQSYLDYAERLRATIGTTDDFAREHQQTSSQRMKKWYDMRSQACTFDRGALVWLHNPQRKKGLSTKLTRP